MQTIFRVHGEEHVLEGVIANNSEVFKDGSLVSKDSSGNLIVATAGLRIYGICREDKTVTSDNETVALYKPLVISADNVDMSMLGDELAVASDLYKWADVSTVAAGLQTVAISTATTAGQLAVLNLQSDVDTDPTVATWQVIVHVAESQILAYAQV
jgi:hypothetical protein